ncbi:SDR family NAD(P)-dependent oxidoreductase [Nonomuraea dietziae]|uniref:SDR family NAD(P)-dependent oxidoreductase n=1 Tax=Nonomuraea dietziae TaxID=65515 RepID=UPI0031E3A7D4
MSPSLTGAGRGIGREEALFFAKEARQVVVNDPGVEIDGTAETARSHHSVVEEIVAAGQAVANLDDVTDGTARSAWSPRRWRPSATCTWWSNNAGIERVRSLSPTRRREVDAVIAVHLKGSFAVTGSAAATWRSSTTSTPRVEPHPSSKRLGLGPAQTVAAAHLLRRRQGGHRGHDHRPRARTGGYGSGSTACPPPWRAPGTMEVPGMSESRRRRGSTPFHPAASAPWPPISPRRAARSPGMC